MATIQALAEYLQKGFTIQSVRGESIRPTASKFRFIHMKNSRWGGFDPEPCSLADVNKITDMWEWGVLFCDQAGKNLYILTEITEIENAIENNTPHAVFGPEPE